MTKIWASLSPGNRQSSIKESAGDGINRKYDFTYDDVNRLTAAHFLQNPSGSTWNTAAIDYSVDSLTYDGNGNIMKMNQKGFKVGAPTSLIDQLTYSYQTNSNQLSQVVDAANDTASTLGDFHYKTKGSFDYLYDGNGNLKIDKNKGIDSIAYNYFDLPQYVHIKGKGTITYIYDAKGLKEAKVVTDSTQTPVKITTTEYIRSYQYTNDTLAQSNLEEGRARWQKKYLLGGGSIYGMFYDYFLKDHLGDTRVILTTEKDTAQYIATMEPANRTTENALFYNIDSTSYATTAVPGGYPGGTNGGTNDSVAIVSGSVGSHTQGPAIILKVMDGDSVALGVNSYYVSGGTAGSNSSSLQSVLNTLAGGLVALGGGGGHGTLANLDNTSGSPVYTALTSFMPSYDSTLASKPKAYLNWMLLDNQFNYVSGNGQSGAIPIGAANVLNTLATNVKLKHSGYLYIWVSNETQNWNVFFDNLSIEDFSGPMLEESHYYPFGLTMAGISDKALKAPYAQNKYRYNGKELQNQEFSDGTGLEEYNYGARMQDPQLGRWQVPDPVANNFAYESPYNYAGNNPESHIDIDGKYKFPANLSQKYQQDYKLFSQYLQSGIQDLLKSANVVKMFTKYTGMSLNQLKKDFEWGAGAEIRINSAPGRDINAIGYTDPSKQAKYIELNEQVIKLLESSSAEDRDAALLVVVAALLHEEAHRCNTLNGTIYQGDEADVGYAVVNGLYDVERNGFRVEDFDFSTPIADADYEKNVIHGAKNVIQFKISKNQENDLPKLTKNASRDDINDWLYKGSKEYGFEITFINN